MASSIRERIGDELEDNHDINVTPFIDVMLVLLMIFMVAVPLATVDVDVDLPASTAQPMQRPDKPLYLTLKSDRTLSVGETSIAREDLEKVIYNAANEGKQTRIFVRADKSVDYGSLMEVMNLLRDAGYLKIALVGLETASSAPPPGAMREARSLPAAAAP